MNDIRATDAAARALPMNSELTTLDFELVYRVPLSGRASGTGKAVLVDPQGMDRLLQLGARFLYIAEDSVGNGYVTFLQVPSHRTQMAARAIIDAPKGRRVVYRNGDRLDLRACNLTIQPRKGC